MKEKIELAIKQIYDNLKYKNSTTHSSILHGDGSALLFLGTYFFKSENVNSEIKSYLESMIEKSNKIQMLSNMANGFTGIAFVLKYLQKIGYIDKSDLDYLDEINEYIVSSLDLDFNNKDFDLLYGYIGKANYLLSVTENYNSKIEMIIDFLDKSSIVDNNFIYWKKNDIDSVDLGLAHGIPSIINFLINCYLKNIKKTKCERIIKASINFIISQSLNNKISMFSNTSNSNIESRLAWCYGDLGILYILIKANKLFPNEKWSETIEKCKSKSISRNVDSAFLSYNKGLNVYDPTFCHGTSGIAYIYKRLFDISQDKMFYKESLKWLELTLNNTEILLENNYFNEYETINGYQLIRKYNLLEGLPGIALVLLSFYKETSENDYWNIIFSLN